MSKLKQLNTTLKYARLGLISLTAVIVPITSVAQELCSNELFEGEADSAALMSQTVEFLDTLKANGVTAFEGSEGRLSIDKAREALQDGVGSVKLLSCVVNSDSIEFSDGDGSQVVACDSAGGSVPAASARTNSSHSPGQLFCTAEVAAVSKYVGSEA